MKFRINSKALYLAISAVSKVINAKNAMTILNNFLIEVGAESVKITASDLENVLVATVPATLVEGEGCKFCIDARRSVELFKELPDMDVEFVVGENLAIVIDYPGGKFNFVGINGDEYPQIQKELSETEPVTFNYPSEAFITGLDNTSFAVGTDDLRPQMMGVFLDIKPDDITFVATDTHKLVKYVNRNYAPGVEASCIVPIKAVSIIKAAFGKEESIEITLDSKSATFKSATYSFNFRFIKGRFPDYNRVIPHSNPYVLTVDRVMMLNAVRRVGVFVDPGHGLVKFHITPEQIEMKTQDINFNTSGREEIPCSFTGNELTIGFGAAYLIEIFSTISTENVEVQLADPSRPGVFVPDVNAEGTELVMLLMPMNINDF